ncbi:ATP synthase subunit f, mitochondrial isoform X2 [Salvelinus alpinus]|uniref:ATP synthase subunit f, mitochondrial isoform X2 n=1 Tax=Salvelinus alpinus TaxID=8036 RepID=UPI0039FDA469
MADRIVPLGEKRLMDVKLGELGSWLGKRDFTPNGILGSIRNGHDRYYNKYPRPTHTVSNSSMLSPPPTVSNSNVSPPQQCLTVTCPPPNSI